MPTYDYVCGACGHRVEVMHGVHDHGPAECPNCHARAMRKAIVSPTVLYKGSGWAKKDRGATARTKAAAKADGTESKASTVTTEAGGSGSTASSEPGSGSGSGSDSGSKSGSNSGSGSTSGSSEPSAPDAGAKRD